MSPSANAGEEGTRRNSGPRRCPFCRGRRAYKGKESPMTKQLMSVGLLLAGSAFSADTQSAAAYLQAPRIRSEIRVQWNAKAKALLWDTGGDHGRVEEGTLFVSKGAVRVLYPRLNPLRLQATASSK